MSRFHSYLSSAVKILEKYDGIKPFMYHLKTSFAAEKKFGSRDRKLISSLCYSYFRMGKASTSGSIEDKILTGLFLSERNSNEILLFFRPEWNERISLSAREKLSFLKLLPADIFPLYNHTGKEIENDSFACSFLTQPDLYVRIRPGRENKVLEKLKSAEIAFEKISNDCITLPNNTSLDKVLKINREVVIQDRNSQQVLDFLKKDTTWHPAGEKITAWDCCAASGGKSILLYDILKGNVKLTVSDIRENILVNLVNRLEDAGINIYKKLIADLSKNSGVSPDELFSLILCDAPCTGSGTWSRNPEQLLYFDEKAIALYAERQKQIVAGIIPHLSQGGLLFYITCSVFKNENEDIVDFIKEKFHLSLLKMEYLKGYEDKADTMFVAVLSRQN